MKKLLIIIAIAIFAFITPKAYSQNYITIGSTNYLSTPVWEFSTPNRSESFVSIGKTPNGSGLIMVKQTNTCSDQYIKGNIIIYLEDLSVIKCIDKGIQNNINSASVSVYYLSKQEIQLLMKSNIKSISFSLFLFGSRSNWNAENEFSDPRNATSTNNYHYNSTKGIYINDTSDDVKELFGSN